MSHVRRASWVLIISDLFGHGQAAGRRLCELVQHKVLPRHENAFDRIGNRSKVRRVQEEILDLNTSRHVSDRSTQWPDVPEGFPIPCSTCMCRRSGTN